MAKKKVALFAHSRTGSTYLRSLIGSHPHVYFYGEVLYPSFFDFGFYQFWLDAIQKDRENLIISKRVTQVFSDYFDHLADAREEPVVGFDVKIPQIQEIMRLHAAIRSGDLHVIHLTREHALRAVISDKIMYHRMATGDMQVHRSYTPERVAIRVNPTEILDNLRARVRTDAMIRDRYADRPHLYLHVRYEDFEAPEDMPACLARVFDFLGLDPAEASLRSELKKQNPHPLAEMVENFNELAAALRGTQFAPQLETQPVR